MESKEGRLLPVREECDSSSNHCMDDDKTLVACLRVPGNGIWFAFTLWGYFLFISLHWIVVSVMVKLFEFRIKMYAVLSVVTRIGGHVIFTSYNILACSPIVLMISTSKVSSLWLSSARKETDWAAREQRCWGMWISVIISSIPISYKE